MTDTLVTEYFHSWNVPAERAALVSRQVAHWIDGAPVVSGMPIAVSEPSTGGRLTETLEAGVEVVDRAVASARQAFEGSWGALRPLDREALILKLADSLEAHQDELAFLESVDVGKPLSQAFAIDIGGAVDCVRYFAGWATKISGRTGDMAAYDKHFLGLTLRQPVGVVAAIAPWNFPLQTLIWKIGAAFAAGCTVVAKPSEVTPVSTLRLAELITQAGFPNGAFNVVNGTGAVTGAALVSHPGVNKVSFTGSTPSGLRVGTAALQNMTRLTLELGGKSPALVFADSNVDAVVEGLYNGIYFNAGQVCDATSRAIVDVRIYDEVRERLIERATSVHVLPGLDPDSGMGPMVSGAHRAKVMSYIEQARADGLPFALDRSQLHDRGHFVGPVIVEDIPSAHPLWREEIFGPVLALSRADGPGDVVCQARDTRYGLGAAIYSRDIGRVLAAARAIDAGTIYVNGYGFLDPAFPFGGLGMSGFGKDMGAEQMEAYLETKTLLVSGIELGLAG
ncbi:aldehyde dehydrogenase family protein [Mesorhizobium sp. M1340]|uniref:aldehyde dehydrogenase family protein n=1 Tax=Mesorhizobium sp. M1340 TaxID=2957087 RepID=UPI003335A46B